jgi:transcriptional regulator with XRE-family HTH domain
MAVTVRDVANRAGVSIATVSRVLNHSAAVTSETKDKVFAAISSLDYAPNLIAVALRKCHERGSKRRETIAGAPITVPSAPAAHAADHRKATEELRALKKENRQLKRLIGKFGRELVKCFHTKN